MRAIYVIGSVLALAGCVDDPDDTELDGRLAGKPDVMCPGCTDTEPIPVPRLASPPSLFGEGPLAGVVPDDQPRFPRFPRTSEMGPLSSDQYVRPQLPILEPLPPIDPGSWHTHRDASCNLLATTGACADACSWDTLVTHIPPGYCMMFRCQLTDGNTLLTGGCNI